MSNPTPPTPSKALSVFLGVLAAFASFAVVTSLIQWAFGKTPEPRNHEELVVIKEELAKTQREQLDKVGLGVESNRLPVYEKVIALLKNRPVKATSILDPKSPTAQKAAAEAAAAAETQAKKEEADNKKSEEKQETAPIPQQPAVGPQQAPPNPAAPAPNSTSSEQITPTQPAPAPQPAESTPSTPPAPDLAPTPTPEPNPAAPQPQQ